MRIIPFLFLLLVINSCSSDEQKGSTHRVEYSEINSCVKLAFERLNVVNELEKSMDDRDSIVYLKRTIAFDSLFYQNDFAFPEMSSIDQASFETHFRPNLDSLVFFEKWNKPIAKVQEPFAQPKTTYGISEIWVSKDQATLCFQVKTPTGGGQIYGFVFTRKGNDWILSESKLLSVV